MGVTRLEIGKSDPLSYKCECSARDDGGGQVLLFNRYFQNNPKLPREQELSTARIHELAAWHTELTDKLGITGKIRVAIEGFNVTVGGTKAAIECYIHSCIKHWSFGGLVLSTQAEQDAYFKPSPGCSCVFQPARQAFIRVCDEITPLGIANYRPTSWDIVEELSPAEFHRRCHEDQVTLLDLRNHYESKIGYFLNPQNEELALRPQIRRFSQWPQCFKRHPQTWGANTGESQLLTYCTGGIRCEKATRWMVESGNAGDTRVATLRGGIVAYLDWLEREISSGRMIPQASLFKGKNYVFDARGTTALKSSTEPPVSKCHICGTAEDRLSKCRTPGCHLILVVCLGCENTDSPRCCYDCGQRFAMTSTTILKKQMCHCEREREASLR